MIYETPRLYTRLLTTEDLPNLKRTLQDEKAMYAYAHAFSDEEVQAWLDKMLTRYQQDGFGLWAVVLKETGEFIGQCGLTKQMVHNQEVIEVGYLLERKHWHHGYAQEAAAGAKEYAFQELKVPEVWSIIRDNNLASMNVAIRNGMLVRDKVVKHYYGLEMPHFCFAVKAK